ncbi:MAG: PEP-CTERM sorting domain-containing protein [Phycisphaerae bacterium]|nr:PEP-CTERM sorting domain-containing protein [Phycisphaerae bacterium]
MDELLVYYFSEVMSMQFRVRFLKIQYSGLLGQFFWLWKREIGGILHIVLEMETTGGKLNAGEKLSVQNRLEEKLNMDTLFAGRGFSRISLVSLAVMVLLFVAVGAQAIVLHPGVAEPTDRPEDNVIGRWSDNASCVAIGREGWTSTNYILANRHQGGGVGTSVWFGDVEYKVAQQWSINYINSTNYADIRVFRLVSADDPNQPANLTDFTLWNTNDNEAGQTIVMGGFGKTRGTLASNGNYYNCIGDDNTELHWGQNTIDETEDGYDFTPNPNSSVTYFSDTVNIDFDGPETTDAAIARWDSGGGWYYKDNGKWVLAGLGAYATGDISIFAPEDNINRINRGIRISSYADQIDEIIPPTPEPATLGLLCVGGLALLRRRK